MNIEQIISKYKHDKLEDFLISEIDDDLIQETIDFVKSSDSIKKEKYKDILYNGESYQGLHIEGNQYLISSTKNKVLIIDKISEENGVSEDKTRMHIDLADFIKIIKHKKEALAYFKKHSA
ncbi:Uncharacterised protein [Listeria grayi]|uniref:Uncharacterized protein n=1 Tax=Listeria grayi TaxID=1641 RepID=A0A378MDZ8_LISGR|nr:hypothetical protein [Listeria grayi]STY44521.1 Uncharacterised protein [Listeria grayi]